MISTPVQNPRADSTTDLDYVYIWLISVAAALGGLLFGWDWVVIGGAKPFFERFFQIQGNAPLSGWVNSCALIGCLGGALTAGVLSDAFGRRRLLLASAAFFAITSVGNGLAGSLGLFVFWRILGGVAIGLASSLSPMYISEVAPAAMRGRLVSVNQLTIVVGVLLAQLVNWWLVRSLPVGATDDLIVHSWFGQQGWRWMFEITALPALLFFLGMLTVPESPRWLLARGLTERAQVILARIGGECYAEEEMRDMRDTILQSNERAIYFFELLQPGLAKALVLGIVLAVFQQWCGINVIFNYAEEIFHAAGYDISSVLKNIAWTGSVNLAFTFVALGFVDRLGRRPLMLAGSSGLASIYLMLGLCYYYHVTGFPVLLLVLAAIGCYAMSLAPVTWVVISEIFPNRIRGAAMSVAVMALWTACFILTYTFPILNRILGASGTFWLYGAICVLGGCFIAARLPETKGKTLEEIEKTMK
jgi:sugar porter (SP) family MFS transporter